MTSLRLIDVGKTSYVRLEMLSDRALIETCLLVCFAQLYQCISVKEKFACLDKVAYLCRLAPLLAHNDE